MTDPKPPEHSGAAISILKIVPRDDTPVVITSEGIGVDGVIARTHAAEGDGRSPPLAWSDVEGAGSWALIVEDPDAPREQPFVHWMIWNIPAGITALPEALDQFDRLVSPQDAVQGRNDMKGHGWFGPKPPPGHGVHHYYFQLFAVDGPLDLDPDVPLTTLVDALKGRVIASGQLVGTYETPEAGNLAAE
jgi:Raf kinase inhibitor-like YbhB/YbcL family protein